MNGKFIVIEGLDGSGKTTQLLALAKNLRALGYAEPESASRARPPVVLAVGSAVSATA